MQIANYWIVNGLTHSSLLIHLGPAVDGDYNVCVCSMEVEGLSAFKEHSWIRMALKSVTLTCALLRPRKILFYQSSQCMYMRQQPFPLESDLRVQLQFSLRCRCDAHCYYYMVYVLFSQAAIYSWEFVFQHNNWSTIKSRIVCSSYWVRSSGAHCCCCCFFSTRLPFFLLLFTFLFSLHNNLYTLHCQGKLWWEEWEQTAIHLRSLITIICCSSLLFHCCICSFVGGRMATVFFCFFRW